MTADTKRNQEVDRVYRKELTDLFDRCDDRSAINWLFDDLYATREAVFELAVHVRWLMVIQADRATTPENKKIIIEEGEQLMKQVTALIQHRPPGIKPPPIGG